MEALQGRVAVVTGGATGIGLAAARRLAANGAAVVIACRDAARGHAVAEEIRESGRRAQVIPTDVTDDSQVAALAEQAAGKHGVIDVWFNNAGVEGLLGPLDAVDDQTVRQLLDTNVKGVYSGMRHAATYMRAGGLIINSASFVGTVAPAPVAVAYGATKAAVVSMTRAAALGLAEQAIDVLAVAPWITDTPMIDRLTGGQGPQARAGFAAQFNPSGKLTPPDQVAEVIADLAARRRPFGTGDVFLIDAGPSVTIMR